MSQAQRTAASAANQFGLPGISSASPGLVAQRSALAANALSAGLQQAEQGRLADVAQNAQLGLAGQLARGGDWLDQLTNLNAFNQANLGYSGDMGNLLLNAIQGRLGAIGGLAGRQLGDVEFGGQFGLGQQMLGSQNLLEMIRAALAFGGGQGGYGGWL